MEIRRVTVTHFFDDLRDELERVLLKIQEKYGLDEYVDTSDNGKEEEYEKYEEDLFCYFDSLKQNNYKHYQLIISILYHDYVLSIQDKNDPMRDILDEEYQRAREKVNDVESLEEYLDDNEQFYSDMVEGFLEFHQCDYFEKRERFLETKELDKYLTKVFPLHILDKLYYVITLTEEDLMSYFVEDGMSAIGIIISALQNLYHFDKNNFDKLIKPLIYKYYKNFNYKRELNESDEDNDQLLELIEKEDVKIIKEKIINSIDYLEYILLEFYNDSFVYDDEYKKKVNDTYQKHKVKKLEEMM